MTYQLMRRLTTLTAVAALTNIVAASRVDAQTFVPNPAEAYEDFTALREPRADVPVGALWVDGIGPYGEGASPDNLVVIRGLNNLAASRSLQAGLTLGLLRLLSLDPNLRDQIAARFNDLTIVRVKDISKLSGPVSEPRIYEALKAGTVTITTDNRVAMSLLGPAFDGLAQNTGLRAERTNSYTIDARDMFLAVRVVLPRTIERFRRRADLGRNASAEMRLSGYLITIDAQPLKRCIGEAADPAAVDACFQHRRVILRLSRPSTGDRNAQASAQLEVDVAARSVEGTLALPVPISDDQGGAFSRLSFALSLKVRALESDGARRRFDLSPASGVTAALLGERLEQMRDLRDVP